MYMKEIKCPTCNRITKWQKNEYRPFCSQRCKLIDLGHWVTESYVIAGTENSNDKDKLDEPNKSNNDFT